MLVSELSPPDEVDRLIFALPPRRSQTVPHGETRHMGLIAVDVVSYR
jgi:hypothetical protein